MAPAAAAASILSATSAAASKRPAASDADHLDGSSVLHQGDDAARKGQQPKQQLECPRCQSTNTKFCYYNNYSTAQPRHFCRACRRYWTHGGTLRDVPVGGASRRSGSGAKRRRVSADPSSSSASSPPQTAARAEFDACLPDLSAFPFLSDGSFLPQFDLGVAPAAFSSWPSVVPDFYDGLAPWDDGTVGATGVTGAWGDIAGLDLSWPPPGN
ncbi:hypothetical protein BAE44_0012466 [Dichanthelium oligosanthes]|uniref:Dof zinc finger protein n=1 Tax=Dichanthelium oligosanthes TaxID=888268 RepID=A0A1E5VN13_9POAL|nr:hypothetical protein BAE44_0012466 [Dichanthelium oligosanthes]